MAAGFRFACGTRKKNLVRLFLERASAISFERPGKCDMDTVKLCCAATMNSLL